jgi:predicted ester cyclase
MAQIPPGDKHLSPITVYAKGDIRHTLASNGTPQMPMVGFDEEFTDIVDYILKITHRIWEEKAIGLIYDYYLHNAIIHTSSGDIFGRESIITGTIQALAAFPDRRLHGEEVIWKQMPGDAYYSSHRIMHEGTNTGYGHYGAPTGRTMRYRAIADCVCKDNQIIEEWLVRDELALIRHLGLDPYELIQRMAADGTLTLPVIRPMGEVERLQGQLPPRRLPPAPAQFKAEEFVARTWHEIWNWRLLSRIDDYYAETITAESASGRQMYGRGAYKGYVLGLLAPFPDLMLIADHICALEDPHGVIRAATRWTLQGTHTGPGPYGRPTGRRVQIIGVTHQLIEDQRISREWTVFDEFALLKQLYSPQQPA